MREVKGIKQRMAKRSSGDDLPRVVRSAGKKRSRTPSKGDVVVEAPHDSSPCEPSASSTTTVAVDNTSAVQLTEEEYLRKVSGRKLPRRAAADGAAEGGASTSGLYGGVNMKLLASDPIYRILHQSHRSDVVEVVKCAFGETECERAATYLAEEYSKGPVRRLRLQMNVGGGALHLGRFLPFLSLHVPSLRIVDLSRNKLTADDVMVLTRALQLPTNASLEVLDLSCNRDIGNPGATVLMKALSTNARIRAVILKHITLDDEGAAMIAPFLASRPVPSSIGGGAAGCEDEDEEAMFKSVQWTAGSDQHRAPCNFFLNVNENCVGPPGLRILGRSLPEHVSLTAIHQRPRKTSRTVLEI